MIARSCPGQDVKRPRRAGRLDVRSPSRNEPGLEREAQPGRECKSSGRRPPALPASQAEMAVGGLETELAASATHPCSIIVRLFGSFCTSFSQIWFLTELPGRSKLRCELARIVGRTLRRWRGRLNWLESSASR
jgi:hypothetical protein